MSRTRIDPSLLNNLSSNLNMGSNKIVSLANGTASTDAAAFGQVKYLQAVQNTSLTITTTTSSSFVAATNQTVTITPTSSSNRIKLTMTGPFASGSASTQHITIYRNGTTELSGQSGGFYQRTADGANSTFSMSYIDSPATTSATTYQVYTKNDNGTTTITIGRTDQPSVMIAEEIV